MSFVLFILILLELVVVSVLDVKTKKIRNSWSLLNLGVALGLHLTGFTAWNWETLIFPVGFILIGFVLFLLDVMGAGDSKFLASLFLLIPLDLHLLTFEKLVISTIMVGGILLSVTVVRNSQSLRAYVLTRNWKGIKDIIRSRFSYAPVMLMTWILLGAHLWM